MLYNICPIFTSLSRCLTLGLMSQTDFSITQHQKQPPPLSSSMIPLQNRTFLELFNSIPGKASCYTDIVTIHHFVLARRFKVQSQNWPCFYPPSCGFLPADWETPVTSRDSMLLWAVVRVPQWPVIILLHMLSILVDFLRSREQMFHGNNSSLKFYWTWPDFLKGAFLCEIQKAHPAWTIIY